MESYTERCLKLDLANLTPPQIDFLHELRNKAQAAAIRAWIKGQKGARRGSIPRK